LHGRAGDRVLRHGSRRGGGGGGTGHHAAALPAARNPQRGRSDDAAMVTVTTTDALRWIVFFPALGFLWNCFFGRRFPGAVKVVGPGVLLASFVAAVLAILQLHALPAYTPLPDLLVPCADVATP